MPSIYQRLSVVLVCPARSFAIDPCQETSRSDYTKYAINATEVLNQLWWNSTDGQWDDQWWNSANALTTLANLVALDPDNQQISIEQYFTTSHAAAAASNGGSFLDNFYDDEGWWALAWIRVYDVTGNTTYLDTAKAIWHDLTTSVDATCGGVWWSKDKQANNAISNELFLYTSAALANRAPNDDNDYHTYALNQAAWFLQSGLINTNHTVSDGLDLSTCQPEGATFTYNSGVILGALIELNRLTNDTSYLDTAHSIAQGAIATLTDANGILTEQGFPDDLDMTRCQFKGIFARNLGYLQAASARSQYADFLRKNADSIYEQGREGDGLIGPNWQGPYVEATMASQSAAMDCLVAAALAS